MHKSTYLIEYLVAPALGESRLGMWGFTIKVSSDFVRGVLEVDVSDEEKTRFQHRVGEMVIRRLWNPELYDNWARVQFDEDSALLWTWAVPGDCACMGSRIDYLKADTPYVEYSPHNVDGMKQSMGLLQIFLMWHDWMYHKMEWSEQELRRFQETQPA